MGTEIVVFSAKGQVVIPVSIRRPFGSEDGTKAAVQVTPDGILIKPITRLYIRSFRGSLKGRAP